MCLICTLILSHVSEALRGCASFIELGFPATYNVRKKSQFVEDQSTMSPKFRFSNLLYHTQINNNTLLFVSHTGQFSSETGFRSQTPQPPSIYKPMLCTIFSSPKQKIPPTMKTYANATNRPTMPDNPIPVSNSRLLAIVFPEPWNCAALGPADELGLVVLEPPELEPPELEPPDVLLGGMGTPVPTELPEPAEPLEVLFPPPAPEDGVMFSGALLASSLNVSMVREWFLAGLGWRLALIES